VSTPAGSEPVVGGPAPDAPARHAADEMMLGFARALRSAGVAVTHDRAATFLDAVSRVGADDPHGVYWSGRATLCTGPDDLPRYDAVYDAWFLSREGLPRTTEKQQEVRPNVQLPGEEGGGAGEEAEDVLQAMASDVEVLRHRDVASLSSAEKALLARMLDALSPRVPRRRAQRRTAWHRGDVDPSRTLRTMLRQHGEPGRVAWRRRGTRPRRLVLLIDVSGSMGPYADMLLRLAHRFVTSGTGPVEVFTCGTRLTHVTRALRHRDPERALVAAGETVPDWSGGTRLGETLKAFLDRWGQRGMARGSVVVVFSDGWERGDCVELGQQAARLSRLAHRVVWVNPHRGRAGYEPVQGGIVAVLPHVDEFVAGHSLATYADLCEVVGRA
jgi:uncharacterized protein with von Willebrand factor type A (vWA) domain